jgi:hypothetical protein
MSRRQAFGFCTAILLLSLSITTRVFFSVKHWKYRIVDGFSNSARVQIAYDSPEARRLIADGNRPDDLLKLPGFPVPIKSYCSIIERSISKCGATPQVAAVYVLIKVTSGPSNGQQGWACETYIHPSFIP